MRPVTELPVRTKIAATATVFLTLVVGTVGYLAWVNQREAAAERAAATETGLPETSADTTRTMYALNRSPGEEYGAITRIDETGTVTRVGTETCDVLHHGGNTLACLRERSTGTELLFLDATTGRERTMHHEVGLPSRAHMSQDGKYASFTTFVVGHSYANPGEFSTYPVIIDVASGIHNTVEIFDAKFQDGTPITGIDRNYWGMAFDQTDSDIFYAALQVDKKTYIVKGSVKDRTAEVILPGYGCPTPSPDGKHLIVRDEHTLEFLLHDLETGETTPLPETRLSDDQAQWVDNETIIYSLTADQPGSAAQPATDLWTLNVHHGEPELLVRAASNASV